MRETHPPGGRSGVPAGCWEHTESGTPCSSPCDVDELVVRDARRPLGARGARPIALRQQRDSAAGTGAQPSTERISETGQPHSSLLSLTLASIFVSEDRVTCERGAAGGGRALCLSSEPSDQGEITSVVAKRKSNERTSFDHLQVRIREYHRAQTTRPSDLLPTGRTRNYTSTYGYSARRDTHPAGKRLSKV